MKKTLKYIFLTILAWGLLSIFSSANAATASINANKTSANVGDSVKVTVSINAASWNLKVSGSASDTIVGYNSDGENQKTTKTYTIDTKKAGTYKVSLSGDITDANDQNSKISKEISISIKEKDTNVVDNNKNTETKKSNNANLKTLGVTPKQYDFSGFNKNKTSYSTTVPASVNSLTVVAKAEDSKAKVNVSGNSGFETGSNNKISIKVTAEDGTTKTYTIKVTKLATDEELPGNLIDEELYLNSLSITGIELSPAFSKDVFSYTANLNDESVNEVTVNAKANNNKAKIEITGNKNLVNGENTINIVLTLDGKTEQVVYQIVLNKIGETSEDGAIETNVEAPTQYTNDSKIKLYIIIPIIITVLIIVAIVVLIILIRKENKKLNEEEDTSNNEEDNTNEKAEEYNVFENDENEFKGQSVEYTSDNTEINNRRNYRSGKPRGKHS